MESSATTTVLDGMRARWRALHVPTDSPAEADDDPLRMALITAIDCRAEQAAGSIWLGGDHLWDDARIGAHASFAISRSFRRLYAMALAWATPGSARHADPQLLSAVIDGLDVMEAGQYRPGGERVGNWYEWQIAGPLAMQDTVMLIRDRLSSDRIEPYAEASAHHVPHVWGTAANRALLSGVVLGRGLLTGETAEIDTAVEGLAGVLAYTEAGDGFHRDGSFLQHDRFAYTAAYGNLLLGTLPFLLRTTVGTRWEPDYELVFDWIRDAFDPLIWRGLMMHSVAGRTISRHEQQDRDRGRHVLLTALDLLPCAPAEVTGWLAPMVKHWLLSTADPAAPDAPETIGDHLAEMAIRSLFADPNANGTTSGGSPIGVLPQYLAARRLATDPSVVAGRPAELSTVFAGMARVVHRRPGWAVAISMCSPAVAGQEAINGENLRGWYVDNGAVSLYTGRPDHFGDGWCPTVDPYRIPGTTVDRRPRQDGEGAAYHNADPWVGGACLSRRHSTAGMRLRDPGSSLTASKSWFCFDDQVVAFGAVIRSADGREVESVVENRRLADGDERLLVGTANGEVRTMVAAVGDSARHSRQPGTEVLADRAGVQAVRDRPTGILAVHAFEPCTVAELTCDSPAAVLVAETHDGITVAAADPTMEQRTLRIHLVNPVGTVRSLHPAITVVDRAPLVLDIDVTDARGTTREIRF